MKLDQKDFEILKLLADNCRIPTGHVAKEIGMSRESTHYRIQRLLDKKVITMFTISINTQKLGFMQNVFYLSLQNVEDIEAITQKIIKHPLVGWTTQTPGKWDLIFDVYTQNMYQLEEYLQNFKKEMSAVINKLEIITQLEKGAYPSKYFGKLNPKKSSNKVPTDKFILKSKDIDLLNLLSENARLDLKSICAKLDVSFPTLKKQMSYLEEHEIIQQYTLLFDQEKVNIRRFYSKFNIHSHSLKDEEKFIKFIKSHPNVGSYVRPVIQASIEAEIFAKDQIEFRKIMNDIRKKFGHVFELERIIMLHAVSKSKIVPKGIFDLLSKNL